jgi:pyruvate kinase
VHLPHPEIFAALDTRGATLLVNDGKIRLQGRMPAGADHRRLHRADRRCTISNRKGVNVPDVAAAAGRAIGKGPQGPGICLPNLGIDWLALSFVQRAADVDRGARIWTRGRAALMAKIEKPAAVKAYAEILAAADGIMVARGDLGCRTARPERSHPSRSGWSGAPARPPSP